MQYPNNRHKSRDSQIGSPPGNKVAINNSGCRSDEVTLATSTRSRQGISFSELPNKFRSSRDIHQFINAPLHLSTYRIFIIYGLSLSILLSQDAIIFVHCKLDHLTKNVSHLDTKYCEAIQPLLVERRLDHAGGISSEKPLFVLGCPEHLDIVIPTSHGDEFVINLVKNKRLISESYFNIIKNQFDKLGNTINHHDPGQSPTKEKHETTYQSSSSSATSKGDDFYKTHKFISLHNFTSNNDHCHYHGIVDGNLNSISALSIVGSKLLSGYMSIGGSVYHLIADETKSLTFIKKSNNVGNSMSLNDISTCQTSELSSLSSSRLKRDTDSSSSTTSAKRRRFLKSNPDNKVLLQPFQSNSSSLFVELLVVHDHSQYTDNDGNTSLIAERTMQIVNIMNAFYRQLNIFVALVGVVLWTEKDEIKLLEDGDATLTEFLKYRFEKLLPRYHHDNAQLITSTSFNGSVVGKALKGPVCTYDHSGGVNTDHSHNPAIVAVTLAHELGHNLGMEHDEDDKCKCPDEKCIMSSSSSSVHPKHWSSCSIEYLEESRKHGLLDCLHNEPTQIFGPVCGNGFVEEGEDCDLGEPIPSYGTSKSRYNKNSIRSSSGQLVDPNLVMRNPCCDRTTCKFTTNSTCAQGSCCDLTKCSVFSAQDGKICRPRRGECDFEETCDGRSESCPTDVYYHDGIECGPLVTQADASQSLLPAVDSLAYNRSRAYCYKGHCASHESQCQLLWGPTGSTSRNICYEQNVHGNTTGNCGYNRVDKTFDSCKEEHATCGMLHCVHDQVNTLDPNRKTGKLNYGFESASILTISFFVMSDHVKIYCHGAIIDAGPQVRDPGMVPNGASCGDERMCLNQKCVSVYEVLHQDWCSSDCNGNGICDNRGVCHCNDGTVGTSCYQFFGSNFHLSLLIYIIMFFGPIVALIVLATKHYKGQIKQWWYLHNRMIALRNKSREPAHQRRMAYNANGRKVSISDPIPLNQHNAQTAANGLFFDPTADPWAETSATHAISNGGKSLGYRLEPINKQLPPPPPPLPDYQARPEVASAMLNGHQPIVGSGGSRPNGDLKPTRSAPPPPIPPHRHGANHQ